MQTIIKANLGHKTDLFTLPLDTEVQKIGDYTVIHTPTCRSYWMGNYLHYHYQDRLPPVSVLKEQWSRFFSGISDVESQVIQWEQLYEPDKLEQQLTSYKKYFKDFSLSADLVMLLENPNSNVTSSRDIDKIHDKEEWGQLFDFSIQALEIGKTEESFMKWRLGAYRQLVENDYGNWWCIKQNNSIVSALGLFYKQGLGRFQEVVTHPEYRKRGHCTNLVKQVLCTHTSKQVQSFVIVTEFGSEAFRIYKRLNFQPVSIQFTVYHELSK